MHKQKSPPPTDGETTDPALEQTFRPSRQSAPVSEVVLSLIQLQQNTKCEGDLDLFLRRLVEEARLLVGATGAALALRDKQIARWRARCGENGPSIGAPLYTGLGISGECLASGRPQSCEDTLSDPRLDAEVCRQLGVRSMVVAPVKGASDDVEGILEAWSPEPRAFDKWCLEILQELARLVTAARSRLATRSMSPSGTSLPLLQTEPTAIVWAFDRIPNLASKVRDWLRRVIVVLFPLLYQFRTRAVVVAILLLILPWTAWRSVKSASARPASTPAGEPEKGLHLSLMETHPIPDLEIGTGSPAPRSVPTPREARRRRSQPSVVPAPPDPSGLMARALPPLATHVPRITAPTAPIDSPLPTIPAPELDRGLKDGERFGDILSAPPVLPALALEISRGLTGGHLETRFDPVYPRMARSGGIEGDVVLQAVVDEQGAVEDVKVMSGHPVLGQAAAEAVRRWRYQPYLLNDQPVRMPVEIRIEFRLN